MAKKKTKMVVSSERILRSIQTLFNPIRNLTPAILANQIESFETGHLRSFALTMARIADRDDILKSVIPKREKAVSRHGWEIITMEESAEADRQKVILDFFYNNISVTSAVDGNERGGFSLLVRQMMDAIGKRYAVHEIIWQPSVGGLTAQFKHVPLWFFENRTGKLRYLESEGSLFGIPLEDAEWMTTKGDGLMIASSIAYIFKHIPLKDWLIYSERHGMPGIQGKTDATEGSKEWNDLVAAVANFGVDFGIVTNRNVDLEQIDMTAKGNIPYPPLVERMDRAMSAMWRGADLSTMSSGTGQGTGASLQGKEAEILESDDAELLSGVLNEQVDPHVIRFAMGSDNVLAFIKLKTATRQDVKQDIDIDTFLASIGVPISVNDILARYNRPVPGDDETLVTPPTPVPTPPGVTSPGGPGATSPAPLPSSVANLKLANQSTQDKAQKINEELLIASKREIAQATANDLEDLRDQLEAAEKIEDPALRDAFLADLQKRLPTMLREMNESPTAAIALESMLAAALINGFAEGAVSTEEVGVTQEAA